MKLRIACCVAASVLAIGSDMAWAQAQSEYPALPPGYPSLDAPWGKAQEKPRTQPPPEAPASTATSPPSADDAAAFPDPLADLTLPIEPRVRKHEISISGDFFLGQGDVTMPFGFSLAEVPGLGDNIDRSVAKPERTSDYIGGTLSYSFGQTWYLDLGYATGESSGSTDVVLGQPPALPSDFEITDDWLQVYVRYTFPGLRGKRLSAYLRAGASFVQAELKDKTVHPVLGLYQQTDETEDLLGNFGFGVGYSLYSSRRIRLGLQFEGEGFYGQRSQDTREVLAEAGPEFDFPTASIDNDLYGGIGRGTIRFEYRLGQSGAFRLFADGGIQGKFTQIEYPDLGSFNELLWGPYLKIGARFSF